MFPLGSEGGFHFRMIWDEELETDMGSSGTDGTVWVGKIRGHFHCPALPWNKGQTHSYFPGNNQCSPWQVHSQPAILQPVTPAHTSSYTWPHKPEAPNGTTFPCWEGLIAPFVWEHLPTKAKQQRQRNAPQTGDYHDHQAETV